MEQFNIEIHRTVDNKDGTFYYELSPTNIELKDILLKGCEGIEIETINNRIEMFNVLEMLHPEIAINYYL
jgi:hypothetical protein